MLGGHWEAPHLSPRVLATLGMGTERSAWSFMWEYRKHRESFSTIQGAERAQLQSNTFLLPASSCPFGRSVP
jgi:hypothetical protein